MKEGTVFERLQFLVLSAAGGREIASERSDLPAGRQGMSEKIVTSFRPENFHVGFIETSAFGFSRTICFKIRYVDKRICLLPG